MTGDVLEARRLRFRVLLLVVFVLLGIDVMLTVVIGQALLTPAPIYVVPGAKADGIALPDALPKQAVQDFALQYYLESNNWTPRTFEGAWEATAPRVAPEHVYTVERAVEELREEARGRGLSVQAILHRDAPITVEATGPDQSCVRATFTYRTFYQSVLSTEGVYEVRIHLSKGSPAALNPYGLYVRAIERVEATKEG